ncbi:MAG: hypothetical protein NT040_18150 [Bacteroidetes bacterium]|nr:hypothetical protein [Bacteroidota bacterium]
MTFEQRNAISNPAEGLMVFCTNCSNSGNGVLSMFIEGKWRNFQWLCETPNAPTAGSHVPGVNQITWNWNSVPGAIGYRWNTTNDFLTATDMGVNTMKAEAGLNCGMVYTRYVWSYDHCGHSSAAPVSQSTSSCFTCGPPVTVNHTAGPVAPATKTVTYELVANLPGDPSKCWISKNLGADHQADSVNDATEASAGWYWQFNRKQGYKHDGTTRTPNTTWITGINESSDWVTTNDPCTIELGVPWRLPTLTEWNKINSTGGWTNWNEPWNSGVKLHAAGYLYSVTGVLISRGLTGVFWSGSQDNFTNSGILTFNSGSSYMASGSKAYGHSVRCIRDN